MIEESEPLVEPTDCQEHDGNVGEPQGNARQRLRPKPHRIIPQQVTIMGRAELALPHHVYSDKRITLNVDT